jgi:F-type H+-transporting ATPase subunit delta
LKDTTIAPRYARALFIVTEKRGETPRALEDLKGLVEVLAPGSPVGRYLASPEIRLTDKRQAIRDALKGRVTPTVVVFLDLLLRKKRLPGFDTVVVEFERLVEKAQGLQRAVVVSAVPLQKQELDRLHGELERFTRSKIRLTAEVDPVLLGGALVRIDGRVIDRSVRTLLDSIHRQLLEVSV